MKTKLIKSLKIAIHALENDTIHYNWEETSSCNCGVVCQAILDTTKRDVSKKILKMYTAFRGDEKNKAADFTWKYMVQNHCSITGKSNEQIFKDLFAMGLNTEDLTHLEFLENTAILNRANIYKTETITTQIKTDEKIIKTPIKILINAPGIKGFFGKKIEKISYENSIEEFFEVKIKEVKYLEDAYYTKKENLIKYLKTWVEILEEMQIPISSQLTKEKLQEELIKAVGDEQYERASELRDLIATK